MNYKKEEEEAARDNLWPKLISSVTESRFVYVCVHVCVCASFKRRLFVAIEQMYIHIPNGCVTNQ